MNRRLQQLENNVAELERIKNQFTVNDIEDNKAKEWALRYGLLESIQIVIDISCHLVVHNNLGNAETYSECIELLRKYDYIDKNLEKNLKGIFKSSNFRGVNHETNIYTFYCNFSRFYNA